jgi:hypothetical protein
MPKLDQSNKNILAAYGDWVNDWMQRGWDGYLVTVMFHNLPGPMT